MTRPQKTQKIRVTWTLMTRGFTAPPLMFESFKATRRLKQMEERMDDFERTMKRIQLEWEETYDKMRLIMQRVAKRAIQIERAEQEHPSPEPSGPSSSPSGEPTNEALSERARAINERILARRNRLQMREPQ